VEPALDAYAQAALTYAVRIQRLKANNGHYCTATFSSFGNFYVFSNNALVGA
jgi:hypothetical protein